MSLFDSYPTLADATKMERMSAGFFKLHQGPVHVFTQCNDTEYHTHPWAFTTHIILGGYIEELVVIDADGNHHIETYHRLPGTSHHMPLGIPHKLIGLIDGVCITKCEYGPSVQKPAFCKIVDGVLHHRYYDERDWMALDEPFMQVLWRRQGLIDYDEFGFERVVSEENSYSVTIRQGDAEVVIPYVPGEPRVVLISSDAIQGTKG